MIDKLNLYNQVTIGNLNNFESVYNCIEALHRKQCEIITEINKLSDRRKHKRHALSNGNNLEKLKDMSVRFNIDIKDFQKGIDKAIKTLNKFSVKYDKQEPCGDWIPNNNDQYIKAIKELEGKNKEVGTLITQEEILAINDEIDKIYLDNIRNNNE